MLAQLDEEQLCRQFCANVRIHRRGDNKIMLETPFSFPDGDHYPLYLSETLTGGIRISDGGATLMHMSYENDLDKFFEGTRGTLLKQVVREQGIELGEEDGQFFIETSVQQLSTAAFKLGQALTRVHDLTFLNRSRVSSTFYEDLSEHLTAILTSERISKNYVVPELPDGANYPVDFEFEGKSGTPVFLFGIPNRDKARLVTICLQHFLQNNIQFDSLLVFQNQEEIPRPDLARLSNVGGEMVSTLNAEGDFRRKVERKAA